MNKMYVGKILSILLGIGLLNLAMVQAYATLLIAVVPENYLIANVASITPLVLAIFGVLIIFRAVYPSFSQKTNGEKNNE